MFKVSTTFLFVFLLLFAGCDSNKADNLFNEAMGYSKSGDEEKCLNILYELANNHSETNAGSRAIQLINDSIRSSNGSSYSACKNFSTNLEAYYSEYSRYPYTLELLVDYISIKDDIPKESSTFSKFVEKHPDRLPLDSKINVFYIINRKEEKYQICSYHKLGTKAYCMSSDETNIFEISDIKGLIKEISANHQKVGEIPGLFMFIDGHDSFSN